MTDLNSSRTLPRARRRAQRWPRWLKVIAALVVVVILGAAGLGAARLLDRREFSSVTLAGPVDRIDLQVASGDVELVEGSDGDVTVQRTSAWRLRPPDLVATVDGSTARIHATCPRVLVPLATCSVAHRIEVPEGVRVDVRTDAGTVSAEGLDGWVRIITSNGRVEATDLASDELVVDTHGGDVEAWFTDAPSRVDVATSGGDVELILPEAPYEVSVRSDGGDVETRVETEELAERMIRVRSDGGSVAIDPPPRVPR